MLSLKIYRPEPPGVAPREIVAHVPDGFASLERALGFAGALGYHSPTHLIEVTGDGCEWVSEAVRFCQNVALEIPASPWRYTLRQAQLLKTLGQREFHYDANGRRFSLTFSIVSTWDGDDLKKGKELVVARVAYNTIGSAEISIRSIVNKRGRVNTKYFAAGRSYSESLADEYWRETVRQSGDMNLAPTLVELIAERTVDLLPDFYRCQDDFLSAGYYRWESAVGCGPFPLSNVLGRAVAYHLVRGVAPGGDILGDADIEKTVAARAARAVAASTPLSQEGLELLAGVPGSREELLDLLLEEQAGLRGRTSPYDDLVYRYRHTPDSFDVDGHHTLAFLACDDAPGQALLPCLIGHNSEHLRLSLGFLDRGGAMVLAPGWSRRGIRDSLVAAGHDFEDIYCQERTRPGSAVAYEAELVRLAAEAGSGIRCLTDELVVDIAPHYFHYVGMRLDLVVRHYGEQECGPGSDWRTSFKFSDAVDSLCRLNRPKLDELIKSRLKVDRTMAPRIRERLWGHYGPFIKRAHDWLSQQRREESPQ